MAENSSALLMKGPVRSQSSMSNNPKNNNGSTINAVANNDVSILSIALKTINNIEDVTSPKIAVVAGGVGVGGTDS